MGEGMNNRLENLETKISYQEHLIQELNDVVVMQQKQIDGLERKLLVITGYLQHHAEQQPANSHEAPPPHY